jgi:transcriptional regulator with XRE-family HTH domain
MRQLNSYDIWERLSNLAKNTHKSLKNASKATGVSEGAISGWKKSFPTVDNLVFLAEYYGVSLDFLVYGETKIYHPPERIANIINTLKNLSDHDLNIVRGTINGILGREIIPEIQTFAEKKEA